MRPDTKPDPEQRLCFKILTLNTHKGFTSFNRRFVLHELREVVRGVSADIVFLQEVLGSHERYSARYQNWPKTSQYEFLADSIWPDFAYGRNAVYPHGHHGNAVLSKFPIVRHQNHDISIGPRERRGLLHCVMTVPGTGTEIHAICTHLGLFGRHRRRQVDLLCSLIESSVPATAPLIIAGDFNDWALRAHTRLEVCAGVREAFVEAQGRAARSFPVRLPIFPLDRIYFRNARVSQPSVYASHPWSELSDHAALAAEVEL